jgi:intracellular sulfur oxidation DsrE/DsrF family protein
MELDVVTPYSERSIADAPRLSTHPFVLAPASHRRNSCEDVKVLRERKRAEPRPRRSRGDTNPPEGTMSDALIPRRSFVSRLAATTAALGATSALACAPTKSDAKVSQEGTPTVTKTTELDTWVGSFSGAEKCIYDAVSADGAADGVLYARNLITLSNEQLGTTDAQMSVIVSFRHMATPFAYNDAMWAKYPALAETLKYDDATTKKRATRNVLLHDNVMGFSDATLPGLGARGVRFAACGAATTFIAGLLAGKTGDSTAIAAELAANLVPGARLVPAGVVILQRAQKGGFAYTFAG